MLSKNGLWVGVRGRGGRRGRDEVSEDEFRERGHATEHAGGRPYDARAEVLCLSWRRDREKGIWSNGKPVET